MNDYGSVGALLSGEEYSPNLYLSSMPLDHPFVARYVRNFADLSQWHKAVMRLFPDNLPGEASQRRSANGFLYRLEFGRKTPRVLVQSYLLPSDEFDLVQTVPMKDLLSRIRPGGKVIFSTHLNAVRTDKNNRRIPVSVKDFPEYLAGGLSGVGRLPGLMDVSFQEITRIPNTKQGNVPLHIVSVTGTGVVTDAEGLTRAIMTGVGKAKAYGCGMLTVLPLD